MRNRSSTLINDDQAPRHSAKHAIYSKQVVDTACWSVAGVIYRSYLNLVEMTKTEKCGQEIVESNQ